jgi:hypothetical protein
MWRQPCRRLGTSSALPHLLRALRLRQPRRCFLATAALPINPEAPTTSRIRERASVQPVSQERVQQRYEQYPLQQSRPIEARQQQQQQQQQQPALPQGKSIRRPRDSLCFEIREQLEEIGQSVREAAAASPDSTQQWRDNTIAALALHATSCLVRLVSQSPRHLRATDGRLAATLLETLLAQSVVRDNPALAAELVCLVRSWRDLPCCKCAVLYPSVM